MRRLALFLIVTATTVSLASCATGQDWPRFRGPNGAGEATSGRFPAVWTDADWRWRVELPGGGHASPVVSRGQVFVFSAKEDGTRIVQCLKTADGSQVWRRDFGGKPHAKNALNSFASATPAVDSQRVFVTYATPEEYVVVALERTSGKEVWRRDLGPFKAEHGHGASPIVVGDSLIVPNDQDGPSFLVAFDCASGKQRWKVDRKSDKASYSTPVVYEPPKDGPPQVIFTSLAHGVTSLDPGTGTRNWELPLMKYRTVGSPTVAAGLIFASCGEGGGGKQMFAVVPGDAPHGIEAKLAYEFSGPMPYVPVPVAKGKLLFLWTDNGIVACYDAPSGKMLWRQRVGGRYYASPVRVGERIYCPSTEGEMVVVAAAEKYALLGKFSLGEGTEATPAVADGTMYVRTLTHLGAVGGAKTAD